MIIKNSGFVFDNSLARRRFANGKTLFQIVEANGSAKEAAKMLVRILETESRQRKVLELRFAGRDKTASNGDLVQTHNFKTK